MGEREEDFPCRTWQVNGILALQKGMPIVIGGPNTANLPGLSSRADRLRSGALASVQTRDHWFDTAAFMSAAAFTLGSDSRTEPDVRAPGLRNPDFSVMRNQAIREHSNVQFRAEAFNILNHPQLSEPDSVTSQTYGRILAGLGNRAIHLGIGFRFRVVFAASVGRFPTKRWATREDLSG